MKQNFADEYAGGVELRDARLGRRLTPMDADKTKAGRIGSGAGLG